MPKRHERPQKMADSQTYTKLSKTEYSMRIFGAGIIALLALGMIAWTVKIFLF